MDSVLKLKRYDSGRSWSMECILKWLEIKEKAGLPFPGNAAELAIDADHSVLLQRLLEGRKVYDQPPPRSFSYPWYELMDEGTATPYEVHVMDTCAIINQSMWSIVAKVGTDDYVISYNDVDNYRLYNKTVNHPDKDPVWIVSKMIPNTR